MSLSARFPTALPMPVMIGHRWGSHEQYERLVSLISTWLDLGVEWENWSIPKTNPIPTDGSDIATEAAVDRRLRTLADQRGVLVVAARAGITFSEICRHEIRGARLLNVPVIVARPMDVNGSTFATERADRICSWRGEVVARAVAELCGRNDMVAKIDRLSLARANPALLAHACVSRERLRRELRRQLSTAARTLLD
jgi:hypothetical protein